MASFLTRNIEVRIVRQGTFWRLPWWELIAPIHYESDRFGPIEVPTGFQTDFASSRLLGHTAHGPAGIHDYLYRKDVFFYGGPVPRDVADEVFLEAMRADGLPWIHRTAMYCAVRIAGWASYHKRGINYRADQIT